MPTSNPTTPLSVLLATTAAGAAVSATSPLSIQLVGPTGFAAQVDGDGHMLTGQDNVLFFDQVDGSAVDINRWVQSSTTMTIAQANGLITLNNSAITTASTVAQLTSIRSFQMYGAVATVATLEVQALNLPIANAVAEVGFFTASGTSAPTDGVFIRWPTTGGVASLVASYAGVEQVSPLFTTLTPSVVHKIGIVLQNNLLAALIDGVLQGVVAIPATQPFSVSNSRQPLALRVYTAGTPPASAPQIQLGAVTVTQAVFPQNRFWEDMLVMQGRGAYQSPLTPFAQNPNHANSTDPVAATLSNTAAGYTTLGGRYSFATVAGAVTDYALFAYQVPASYQLCIRQIAISALNTGAAVATTPTVLDWSVGLNASAVSLATTDGANTWAPRRIPLGLQSFIVAAGIGAQAADLVRMFSQPLVVDGGRFLHIILELPIGTATASQVIRGDVTINGWFE